MINPHRQAPEGSFDPTPTPANLADSLREMVATYWGEGDGQEPSPHMVMRAQVLLAAYDRQLSQ
jgi:hypothetical protein